MEPVTAIAAVMILVGLVGIAVPLLPGLLLVWLGVVLWATERQSTDGWVVLGVATVVAVCGLVLQYLLPGRSLRDAGVTIRTTLSGVVLAVVGFFVIPVLGLFLGFALGVYLAELARHGSHAAALPSTKRALRAIVMSIGIELATGVAVATTWVIGLLVT